VSEIWFGVRRGFLVRDADMVLRAVLRGKRFGQTIYMMRWMSVDDEL
jgi:hypothetical protein